MNVIARSNTNNITTRRKNNIRDITNTIYVNLSFKG